MKKYEYTATVYTKKINGTVQAKNSLDARKRVKETVGKNCKDLVIIPLELV